VCMVTFVPSFVSQPCADWLNDLKAEAVRRGLDPKDFGQLYSVKAEWEDSHPPPKPRSTGQLECFAACQRKRCPLTWENGSC